MSLQPQLPQAQAFDRPDGRDGRRRKIFVDDTWQETTAIRVRMLRAGEGPPLVFLHGAEGRPEWSPFFEDLAGSHKVYIPEHPGFGKSNNPPWLRSVGDVAMYYLDFLERLPHPRVHLVGHELGGWIAAELAVRNNSRLAALVLIAPAGLRVKGMPPGDNFIWSPQELARNLFYDQSFAERMLARTLTDEEADIALSNRFSTAKLAWEPRWFTPGLERWLHRIQVPTLVLWGEHDKVFPMEYLDEWAQRLHDDHHIDYVPEAGHLPYVEQPRSTVLKILSYLERRL